MALTNRVAGIPGRNPSADARLLQERNVYSIIAEPMPKLHWSDMFNR